MFSVVLYQQNSARSAAPVAALKLAYLVRNGSIYAGQMILQGQNLYVASGQGDLQLYDISPWMEARFTAAIEMKNYFSVMGDVTGIAFHPRALYAGSTFAYLNDAATENPVEDVDKVNINME